MIDLGISKMALIGVVALIVIGPEKLPRVARMAGTLLGRAQRYIGEVKSQVTREMELEELRSLQQQVDSHAKDLQQSVGDEITGLENSISPEWNDSGTSYHHADMHDINAHAVKVKNFRRKKLARTTAVPEWYKKRHQIHARVISGAARMNKHRARSQQPSSFF